MPGLNALPFPVRRTVNRFFGRGPWRTLPLEQLIAQRADEWRFGMNRPESFSGLLEVVTTPPQAYPAVPPLVELDPSLHQTFPTGPRFLAGGLAPARQTRVWTLTDVIVSGSDGLVWCPHSRTAVAETARDWSLPADRHTLLGALRHRPARGLHGLSFHLAVKGGENFYHFLNESFARLAFVPDLRKTFDWFVITGPRDQMRPAWLELAGIPLDRVVWLSPLESVHCEQLVATDMPMATACPTPAHVKRLHSLLGHQPGLGRRHLWISRADASVRHLAWEDALLAHLPSLEKIRLAGQSPRQQLELFSTASVVVAPHGAGLTNLAWVPPGGCLVELFPPDKFIDPGYGRCAEVVGWRHTWATVDFEQPREPARLAGLIDEFIRFPSPKSPLSA